MKTHQVHSRHPQKTRLNKKPPVKKRHKLESKQTQAIKHHFKFGIKKTAKFLLPLVILFLLLFLISKIKIFKIKNINCYYEDKLCSRENINNDPNLYNQNLLKISKKNISDYYLNNYPQIDSVKISKKYPNSLEIKLFPRQVIAQLKDKQGNYFFIDKKAKVIKRAYNSQIPTITTNHSFEIGTTINSPSLLASLEILILVQNSQIPIETLELENSQSLKIIMKSGQIAYLNPDKNSEKQVDGLQFILQNSTINENKKITTIDLRYDSPVVETTPIL